MNERERIERFEAAYNRIDHGLEQMAGRDGSDRRRTFASKVRIAAHHRRRLQRYKDFLLEIGELRNAIVHNKTGDDLFLAVPSSRTVEELERIENRVLSPARVIPHFARQVITLHADQTLHEAWTLIRDDGFSRYPVYRGDGFQGLLTSNGFARWCAGQLTDGVLHVDTSAVSVADVLAADHRRDRVEFVGRDTLIDEVDDLFATNAPLEAVVITEHGKRTQSPLGLVCPGDLVSREG